MSLRARIILLYALLVGASFSVVIWLIIHDVRPRYLEAVEESMVDTAEVIAAFLSEQIDEHGLHTATISASMAEVEERRFTARIYTLTKNRVNLRIYVTDKAGSLVYDSSDWDTPGTDYSRWRDVYLTLRGEYGARATRTNEEDPSTSVLYVAAPVIKDNEIEGVVSIGKPSNSISFLILISQRRFVQSLVLVAITGIVLAGLLSFLVTRPVRRLTDYAASIRQGETKPLPALGSPEIKQLGQALEEMQSRLEGKNYIEDYVRALTHELKSPITGIKGAAEILREEINSAQGIKFLDNIDSGTERMHSLVDRMLQLSRLENVHSVSTNKIEASNLFTQLAESFSPQLASKKLCLELNIEKGLRFEADELLIRQAIGNLINNAIDFSPAGGVIRLNAAAKNSNVVICVEDNGGGIPDFAINKVFDKFFSLSRPYSGKKSTGLGLPFVSEVVTRHSGRVELENTSDGLRAIIFLPL